MPSISIRTIFSRGESSNLLSPQTLRMLDKKNFCWVVGFIDIEIKITKNRKIDETSDNVNRKMNT